MILSANTWIEWAALVGAVLGYVWLATGLHQAGSQRLPTLMTGVWLLHALALGGVLLYPTPHFGFAPALSVMAWLVFGLYIVELRLYPQIRAKWGLAGFGALSLLLMGAFPGAMQLHLSSRWLPLHWALGVASYGLLAMAVVHAGLMQHTEHGLKSRLPQANPTGLPLLALERLTFRFVWAAFVLLSATIAAGVFFAQLLDEWRMVTGHKAIFTVLSWATLGVLLWGRHQRGWRSRTAARMVYVAAGLLLLGYVGSRFVLEIVLGRVA